MEVQSAAKDKRSPHRSLTSIHKILENPKLAFAFALLLADALLVSLIIAYVPCKLNSSLPLSLSLCVSCSFLSLHFDSQCNVPNAMVTDTKIDWDAYMSQVSTHYLLQNPKPLGFRDLLRKERIRVLVKSFIWIKYFGEMERKSIQS